MPLSDLVILGPGVAAVVAPACTGDPGDAEAPAPTATSWPGTTVHNPQPLRQSPGLRERVPGAAR